MTSISFKFIAPPFSINKAYYLKSFSGKSATKIRTKECREWGDEILLQMHKRIDEVNEFSKRFNDKINAIRINIVFGIPEKKFFTKAGHISLASCDITNVEKLLVDVLFDERFNGRMFGNTKVNNLNINDKFIVQMVSTKVPTKEENYIKVDVDIISNKEIL